MTLDEAKHKPRDEDDEIMKNKIKDPAYPQDQWKKVEHTHELSDGTIVDLHYWENRTTGGKTNFKFKNR